MITKRQLVSKLFGELALVGYEFDMSPEEQQDAAGRIEAMVANWALDGTGLPYNFSADLESIDLDADSGVPLAHMRTVYTGAAIDYAATLGKSVHVSTRTAFAQGFSRLQAIAAFPPPVQLPSSLPAGAGNRRQRANCNPFMPTPDLGPLQIAGDGGLAFGD
ncbi:MAG TPA: packaged DNA stabilization gp4 family protein [Roseateles sp.]